MDLIKNEQNYERFIMNHTKEELESAYNEDLPPCHSCGWCPAFYEIEFELEPDRSIETEDCYWAPCVSKDDDDPGSHRGHFLYVKKK